MSWGGGKKALRDAIIDRFPLYYERYIEVFGGAGWVLFRKSPGLDFEVWNDRNSNLTNLYRCVREQPEALKEKLRYCLNAREDFNILAELRGKMFISVLTIAAFVQNMQTASMNLKMFKNERKRKMKTILKKMTALFASAMILLTALSVSASAQSRIQIEDADVFGTTHEIVIGE